MKHTRLWHKKAVLLTGSIIIVAGGALVSWHICANLAAPVRIRDVALLSRNIQYCSDNNHSKTLDFYRPINSGDETLPLAIYIHGGGWQRGSKNGPLLDLYGSTFIKKGMAVATVDYRLNPPHPYPDQNDDIACALTYLYANSERLHIDAKKVIYFGDSAGGELAAFAALNIPYKHYDYEAPVGVIDFYGVSDFSKIISGPRPDLNARWYLGSKYNKVASAASPTTYITKHAPRFLLFHGTKDTVVPIAQSQTLYNHLIKAGIDAEYVTLQGARHAFEGPELSSNEYTKIQGSITTFLKETIDR